MNSARSDKNVHARAAGGDGEHLDHLSYASALWWWLPVAEEILTDYFIAIGRFEFSSVVRQRYIAPEDVGWTSRAGVVQVAQNPAIHRPHMCKINDLFTNARSLGFSSITTWPGGRPEVAFLRVLLLLCGPRRSFGTTARMSSRHKQHIYTHHRRRRCRRP